MVTTSKHYIVYRTTNMKTGEYYVGVHGQLEDDSYLGSGVRLKRSMAKHGKENFVRETLSTWKSEAEAFQAEVKLLSSCLKDPACLNISVGGDGGPNFAGRTHSQVTKQKLSAKSSSRVVTEETREKLSRAGRQRPPEVRAKAAQKLKEKFAARREAELPIVSPETSLKLSKAHKPKVHSDSTRIKLSERAAARFESPEERAKVGRVWSDADREAWGVIQREKWTPERRAKLSQALKGKPPWNKRLECGHIVRDKCPCSRV